jgi:hypothetical protein
MTAMKDDVRHYEVARTPQGAYRTWMAATGRFVFAYSFEALLAGLQFAEWKMSSSGRVIEVHVAFRSVIETFSDGEPYPLCGGPVHGKPEVHDEQLGIDAAAETLLELEQQVRYQVHLGRIVCPSGYGRLELVYQAGFTIGEGASKALVRETEWNQNLRDESESDISRQQA